MSPGFPCFERLSSWEPIASWADRARVVIMQDDYAKPSRRWPILLISVDLALALLGLSLLDYAWWAGQSAAFTAALVLLGLFGILAIAIYRREGVTILAALAEVGEISAKRAQGLLLGLTLLAAALRFCRLGHESFWYDETWTALAASQPWIDLLTSVNPLPHLVARACLELGRSEFALRLGPAFAGVLLIPSTYLLGRTLCRRREGIITAGLITVSVHAIYHSQELRFYAWQMLFSTWTLILMLRGLEGRHWAWMGFALATALNLHSHPFGLLLLASEGLYTVGVAVADSTAAHRGLPLGARRRYAAVARRLILPAISALVALVAFGPGWGHLFSLTQSPTWTLEAENALVAAQGGPWYERPAATWTYKLPSLLLALSHPAWLGLIFSFSFAGLLSLSHRRVALVLLCVLIPPAALLCVKVNFYHRYLSYFLPLMLIVTARGIGPIASALSPRRPVPWRTMALLTVLLATPNLVQLPEYYRDAQKEQWREVTLLFQSNRQPGDSVVVMSSFVLGAPRQPFDWYVTAPPSELPLQFFHVPIDGAHPTLWQELDSAVQGHRRVWFVIPLHAAEIEKEIAATLVGSFRLVQKREFVSLQVQLYQALPE